nr:Uncharacterised protein [Klebsiella pneumoniae]
MLEGDDHDAATESTIAVPDDRRKQLGPFCALAVKASIRSAWGCPVGRRRTPGLRREEVAMLADVGVTGTPAGAGAGGESVGGGAGGVANALQCSPLETRHLFVLAGLTPPEATR